ncbi:MAG: polysaccharide lyase [Bryobacterales bacterium]|nr:polysaccharide lyase [Bryobacterales bacterium]
MRAILLVLAVASGAAGEQRVHLGFEQGSLAGWRTDKLAHADSAVTVTNPVRKGLHAVRFQLRAADSPRNDGIRAELQDDYHAPRGREVWYSFSTYIAEDFPRWEKNSVISQWKGSTDKGEYDDRSPMLAHRYWNGALVIDMRVSTEALQQANDGQVRTLLRVEEFPRGVWHDFRHRVVWSHEQGELDIWLNGKQVVSYRGPVGYNDRRGPYFKLGLYHHDGGPKPFVIYHDEYKRGLTRGDVD